MTPKQIYKALAIIGGHTCSDGENFLSTSRITQEHLRIIQARLTTLLSKLNYMRFSHDFPGEFRPEPQERISRRRRAQAQRAEEQLEIRMENELREQQGRALRFRVAEFRDRAVAPEYNTRFVVDPAFIYDPGQQVIDDETPI